MKKVVSSVDEKIAGNDNNWGATAKKDLETMKGSKILQSRLMKKTKSNLKLLKDKIHFFYKQLGSCSNPQSCLTAAE